MDGLLNEYIVAKALQGLSDSTLDVYERAVRHFLDYIDGDVAEVTASDVRAYLASHGWNPTTIGIQMKCLRTFFRWAINEGLIESNPMDGIPTPKTKDVFPYVMDEDEAKALLKAARKPRDKAIVLTLLDTGLRASELCSLTTDDLDLRGGSLMVRKGKGGKSRMVYFSPVTGKAIAAYLAKRVDMDACLFRSQVGGPLDRNSLRQLIHRLGEKAGLEGRISPHTLRHTFATFYVKQGGDPHSLQKMMGHSSTRMAEKYVNLCTGDVQEIHRRVNPLSRLR